MFAVGSRNDCYQSLCEAELGKFLSFSGGAQVGCLGGGPGIVPSLAPIFTKGNEQFCTYVAITVEDLKALYEC